MSKDEWTAERHRLLRTDPVYCAVETLGALAGWSEVEMLRRAVVELAAANTRSQQAHLDHMMTCDRPLVLPVADLDREG